MSDMLREVKEKVDLWTSLYLPQARSDGRVPTDLRSICSDNNIKVYEADLDYEHAGYIVDNPHTRDKEIWIRSKDAELRKRFTIAHELGHFIFDRHMLISNRSALVKKGTQLEEDRANLFAANLLMPDRRFRTYMRNFSAHQLEAETDSVVRMVAHRFIVHIKTSAIHLKNEGYITQDAWRGWMDSQG